MKGILLQNDVRSSLRRALCLTLIVSAAFVASRAQSPEMATAQNRIERARSLAVVGNFTAAATELEAVRAETTDDAARDVASILLMGVYIKQSNYTRADALLDGNFKARTKDNDNTTRAYFTLAGQLINGVRSRLDGYREFGLNPASAELSAEARSDVDQLRVLLERVVDQARQISDENARSGGTDARNMDATALIEDAAAVRLALARDVRERTQWQREVAEARQRLVGSGNGAAKMSRASANRAAAATAPTVLASANRTTPPATATNSNAPATSAPAATNNPNGSNANTGNAAAAAPASTASSSPPQQNPSNANNANRPATQNASGTPVAVGSLVEKATQRVSPNYPATARSLRVSGVVMVHVVVNEQGAVEKVERMVGPNLLQPAAADAARRWKFRPTLIEGQPVRVAGYISFNFAL
ncbi:MAG TPA: TonB family protein [Pyrinomonadaceae bacterium]